MRKIFFVVLFVMGSSVYAMSFQQAKVVYYKIARANNINPPRFYYSNSGEVNAEAGVFGITINRGMLNFVRNNDELAMVLAHEFAHRALWHLKSTHANEFAADKLGGIYVRNTGVYNKCNGAKVFLRFYQGPSKTHPRAMDRYKQATKGC